MAQTKNRPDLHRAGYGIRLSGGIVLRENPLGNEWFYKEGALGGRFGSGKNPDTPNSDLSEILAQVGSGDTIYVRGAVYANLTAPAAVNDVSIVGASTGPRHGSPTNTSEMGAASWRTASGVTDEPLFIVHTQGWRFANLLFAAGSADAAIELQTDSGATPEKTVSGTTVYDCRFSAGKYAVHDNGGAGLVTLARNRFEGQTTASVFNTAGGTNPLMWSIEDNFFGHASATHIDAPLSHALIRGNVFATVASTAHYIDLTGGGNNTVVGNYLAGTYAHADYQDAAGDVWAGNYTEAGITTAAPAA